MSLGLSEKHTFRSLAKPNSSGGWGRNLALIAASISLCLYLHYSCSGGNCGNGDEEKKSKTIQEEILRETAACLRDSPIFRERGWKDLPNPKSEKRTDENANGCSLCIAAFALSMFSTIFHLCR